MLYWWGSLVLGCVHTCWASTSAGAPAQNGAVFRHWVPDLLICSNSTNRVRAHCIKVCESHHACVPCSIYLLDY